VTFARSGRGQDTSKALAQARSCCSNRIRKKGARRKPGPARGAVRGGSRVKDRQRVLWALRYRSLGLSTVGTHLGITRSGDPRRGGQKSGGGCQQPPWGALAARGWPTLYVVRWLVGNRGKRARNNDFQTNIYRATSVLRKQKCK